MTVLTSDYNSLWYSFVHFLRICLSHFANKISITYKNKNKGIYFLKFCCTCIFLRFSMWRAYALWSLDVCYLVNGFLLFGRPVIIILLICLFYLDCAEDSLKRESGSKVQHANIQASKVWCMFIQVMCWITWILMIKCSIYMLV